MIMTFRCPPELKKKIDQLVDKGLYSDFSSFCTASLENQLLLEESHTAKAEGPLGTKPRPSATSKSRLITQKMESATGLKTPAVLETPQLRDSHSTEAPRNGNTQDQPEVPSIPTLLSISGVDDQPPAELPPASPDIFSIGQEILVERWLFGQYNRLLPVKVSVRALATLSRAGKDAMALEQVGPQIAEVAAQFGDYLRHLDQRFGNHRDEARATAFPDTGAEGQKGKVRYQNQFVGHTAKGEQGGLVVGLKLAVIQTRKNKPHIFLTTAGWEMARLPNPLLDSPPIEKSAKFSDQEIAFFLKHIRESVPVEFFPYRLLLTLIAAGDSTPEAMRNGIAKYLGPNRKIEDEQDFISTQRTGVLGRMSDLNLVGRERQGTRITYHLTPRGQGFLGEVRAITA